MTNLMYSQDFPLVVKYNALIKAKGANLTNILGSLFLLQLHLVHDLLPSLIKVLTY